MIDRNLPYRFLRGQPLKPRTFFLLHCLKRIVTWILIRVSARARENVVLALNWDLHYYILISTKLLTN